MKKQLVLLWVLALTAAGGAAVTLARGTLQENASGYSLKVAYPVLKSGSARADEAFNANSKKFAQRTVARFKKDYQDTVGREAADPAWSLEMDFEEEFRNGRLLGLLVTGYEFTGGAHGSPIVSTLVFDLKEARELSTQDLFRPGSGYLERLSEVSRAELLKRDILSDPDWIARGAGPQKENYELVVPVKEGLKVFFPPYAVAPYAAGSQTVVVPYAKVADILNLPLP